jgi:hypothetical protein
VSGERCPDGPATLEFARNVIVPEFGRRLSLTSISFGPSLVFSCLILIVSGLREVPYDESAQVCLEILAAVANGGYFCAAFSGQLVYIFKSLF